MSRLLSELIGNCLVERSTRIQSVVDSLICGAAGIRPITLTSIPFVSILSYWDDFVQYSPAYRFLLIRRYGKYTFSNSSLMGLMNFVVTRSAASAPGSRREINSTRRSV